MEITKIVHQNEYSGFILFDDALDFDECWELVKTHVKKNNIRISGEEHQEKYLPIIDDKYVFLITQRAWGTLMTEVWSIVDNIDYKYSNWAWWKPIREGNA